MFKPHSTLTHLFSLWVLLCAHTTVFSACQEGAIKVQEDCVDSHKVHYVQPGKQNLLQSVINEADTGDYIILKSGDYEIESTDNHTALLIANKKSLTLIGQDNVWLKTKQGWVAVLTIQASEDITLHNLGLIHDVRRGYCEGTVLKLQNAKNISITDTILNGSGTHAVFVDNSQHVSVTGGKAVKNTEGVFHIKDSADVTIKEVAITDNDNSGGSKHGILDVEHSNNVFFKYNTVKNNKNAYFRKIITSQDVEITNNDFEANQFSYDTTEPDNRTSATANVLWSETVSIRPDWPDFTFELVGAVKHKMATLKELNIYKAKTTKPFQILQELASQMPSDEKDKSVKIEDVNFDGYQDLRIFASATADSTYYRFWLFDPSVEMFVENKSLGTLPSPFVDTENRQIISTWKGSELNYGIDHYQFVNDQPLLIRQELQDFSKAGVYLLTVKERVADQLVTVKQQRFVEGNSEVDTVSQPDVNGLIKQVWQSLDTLFANTSSDNCPSDLTRLPDRGVRGFYCHLQNVLSYTTLQQAVKSPIFVSGPHRYTTLNLNTTDDFGHYHIEFVKWLADNLIPAAQQREFQPQTQPLYEKYVRRLARTFYEVHQYFQDHPDYLAQEAQQYGELVKNRTLPACCYETRDYSAHFQFLEDRGYDLYEVHTAVNFWLRRTLDETYSEWVRGLQRLLEVYDGEFLLEMEETGRWYDEKFREFLLPLVQPHCSPQQVLLYSAKAEPQITRYATINEALRVATQPGDVLWLCPGTYNETVHLVGRHHLAIYGDNAHLVTRIPKETVLTIIDSEQIDIVGLHLLHEVADSAVENGLSIRASKQIQIRDNRIEAGYHGLSLTNVDDVEITGNQIQFAQIGMVVQQSSQILLKHNQFLDNNIQDISLVDQDPAAVFQHHWQTVNEFIRFPRTQLSLSFSTLETAASKGDLSAQLALAFYWYRDDDQKTLHWLLQAAQQGETRAQYQLGWMYYEGRGGIRDYFQAAEWFRKAAQQGLAGAQNALAGLYWEGKGLPQDKQQAVYWVRKAAQQGLAKAQNNLAGLYYEGNDVPQDLELAVILVRKAAEQGYAPAQYNLGELYRRGLGVPRNLEEAKQWFEKAAARGYVRGQEK